MASFDVKKAVEEERKKKKEGQNNSSFDAKKAVEEARKQNALSNDAVKLNKLYSMSSADIMPYLSNGNPIAYTTSDGQNITWQKLYDDKKKEEDFAALYGSLSSSDDWDEYVQKGANIENPTMKEAEGWWRLGQWRFGAKDVGNIVTYSRDNANYITLGDMNGTDLVGDSRYTLMSDNEVSIYNYYLAKYGSEKASEYLQSIDKDLTTRYEKKLLEGMAQAATESPVLSSAFSVGMNLFAGAEYIGDTIKHASTGETDTNFLAQGASTIRGTVSANTDWMIGNWDAFDFLYNTTMSAADSITSMALLGNAGGFALGLSAAAQGTNDALARGMDNKSAFWNGLASGVFEGLFETVSIGNFKALQEVATTTFRQFAKNIGKSMLVNASEETLTEIANIAYDWVANGDFSQYETSIRQYMQSGMSESDAKKKVALELGAQIVESGASGALMGFGFGAAGSAINNYRGAADAKETYGTGRNLVGEAIEFYSDGSKTKALAETYQKALDGGKNLNGGKLYKLATAYDTDLRSQDTTKIKSAVEARLTELGEESNISELSDVIVKQVKGEELTADEKSLLRSSYMGQRVASELDPYNIASGEYTSEWAEKIGTARINAGAYNKSLYNLAMEKAGVATEEDTTSATVDSTPTEETAPKAKNTVSDDGKTVLINTGEEVEIQGIASIKDGKVTLRTNKGEVDSKDISFGTDDEALLYEAVTDMSAEAARNMVEAYDPSAGVSMIDYVHGFKEAYKYGYFGFAETELTEGAFTKDLDYTQTHRAYVVGKNAGEAAVKEAQAARTAAKKGDKSAPKKGKVYINGNEYTIGKKTGLSGIRDTSVKGMVVIADALGVDVHFYESYVKDGKRVYRDENGDIVKAPHGFYDADGIHIDLNAGKLGEGLILYTAAHELTHFIRDWSPAKFKVFADFLLENYAKNGKSVEELIQDQIDKAAKNDRVIDYNEAYEEVIADSCQAMLADGKAIQKLGDLKAKDATLWNKIKDFISSIVAKIRKAYEGLDPYSDEGRFVKQHLDVFEQLKSMWVDALVDAGETYSEVRDALGEDSTIKVNEDGEFLMGETNDGKILYNDRTWDEGGREILRATLALEGYSEEDIKAAMTIMDGKHALVEQLNKEFSEQDRISQATLTTDLKTGNAVLSALVSNGDYPVNIDLLMVCKKRQAYQRVINRLCDTGLIKQATLDALAIAEINKILGNYGFETACLGCFVESRRIRIQEWAETICKEWNGIVDKMVGKGKAKSFNFASETFVKDLSEMEVEDLSNDLEEAYERDGLHYGRTTVVKKMEQLLREVPSLRKHLTVADLITPQGRTHLKQLSSELNSLVACRYGSNTPKIVQDFNPYNHELAQYGTVPTKYKSLREYLYAIGGARMQSFSDFIVENWFDYCQIVADLAARKLPMHTYTKEIVLAKLFGMTGIKINMSLIPDIDKSMGKEYAGLTRNAKGELELIWGDKDRYKATGGKSYMQSINFADALELMADPRYSANVGTIAVGVSDKHILMMLDDPRIRMIIPYHSSGMNPIFANLVGTEYYNDYTDVQNTTIKQLYDSKGNAVTLKLEKSQRDNLTSGFEFNAVLQELGDARAAAEAYKEWCADASKHSITIKGETYTAVLNPKFEQFASHENYYKLLEDFNTYDCITEQAAQQGDVQQIYPDEFEDVLRGELTVRENYRQKQEPKWEAAMGEIESYLKTHTKKDTLAYAKEHGIKLSKKDRKLSDRVTDQETLDFLNEQLRNGEVTEVYRAMTIDEDRNLYPPMAGYVRRNGKKVINGKPSIIGEWEQSVESIPWDSVDEELLLGEGFKHFEKPTKDYPNGRFERENTIFYKDKKGEWKAKFHLDKDNGSTVDAAYAPYIHTSLSVLNDQFTSAYTRGNLVVVRGYVPNSEVNGVNGKRYQANFAEKPVGETTWHSGVVAAQMPETRTVILSRYFMPIEIVDDAVVAQKTKEMMKGNDIEIPFNVVTPRQRRAMEAIGIRIGEARGLKDAPKKADVKYSDRDSYESARDFVNYMHDIVKSKNGKFYGEDVFDYLEKHPELSFIDRILKKDKTVKADLESFLNGIDNASLIKAFFAYMRGAYWRSQYRGAVRTLQNAVKKRLNDIASAKVNGTNLGVENGDASLDDIKSLFDKLNTDKEIGALAEKVFATSERLGVNIRFANQMFSRDAAGDNIGDMVEYKTSYFNDRAVSDQKKASTLLHELIHACTIYAMSSDLYTANAAAALEKIYDEIKNDPDFKGAYGIKDSYEMVAELSNPKFVSLLKKKSLWQGVLDWICNLFGFSRGTTAYDNAMQCLDHILDNPDVTKYRNYATDQRSAAWVEGYNVFGKTVGADGKTRYSDRDSYAPVFYSHMGKTIDDIKIAKMGAGGVVPYLKGRGVKDEEIKWSGIEAFLEGKKSVTKEELQEFVAGSQLQIVEQMAADEGNADIVLHQTPQPDVKVLYIDGKYEDIFRKNESGFWVSDELGDMFFDEQEIIDQVKRDYARNVANTNWSQYKLDGGTNYRELVFQMPNNSYSNQMMRLHWGLDAEGVLAHARMQDMDTSDGKMLFIEEIQSDYHNEGAKDGYVDSESEAKIEELKSIAEERFFALEDYSTEMTGTAGEWETIAKTAKGAKLLREYRSAQADYDNAMNEFVKKIPDAPFKDTYHEYVLKRLIRMAAEEGYDLIGWTPAEIQDERWADGQYHSEGKGKSGNLVGYTIEYDQDMPKFLRKYGKKWGATVGKTALAKESVSEKDRILKETEIENTKRDIERAKRELARKYDSYEKAVLQRSIDSMEKTVATLEKELSASLSVWSMPITDSMKQSVLTEGQPLYSDRSDSDISNRELLANALETAATNDIERNKLAQYKQKIALIDAEEQKLHELKAKIGELSFAKGRKDVEQIRKLQFEAKQAENRINTYDRQLLNLEASAPLKAVLEREKKTAYKKAEKRGKDALAAYREKAAADKRKLLERAAESRQKGIEGRRKTEMRHKIKKVVSDLDNLLRHGSKERNVKLGLQAAVASALEAINMDTVAADERIEALKKELMKAKTPEKIQEISRKIDNIRAQGDRMKSKLEALRLAYVEIKNSEEGVPDYYKNEATLIADKVDSVMKKVGDTPLRNMSLAQLQDVHDLYSMVLTTVRNVNSLFVQGKLDDLHNNVSAIMSEEEAVKPLKEERLAIGDWWRKQAWNEMIPVYAFERLGSKTLTKFFWETVRGQNTFAVDINDAKEFSSAVREKYGYAKWDLDKIHEFKLADGRTFRLSLRHMMSIYAYSKREQALDHMRVGGFFFNDKATFRKEKGVLKVIKSNEEGYKVDDSVFGEITAAMEKEAKGSTKYVEEMQEYLTKMGEKGNDVSRVLWGIDIFKEKVYFPLKSSRDFIYQANQPAQESSLKNDGMTKETIPHASNPIVLEAFDDVWANHVARMSRYHAFVLPIENLNKIHNYGTWVGTSSMSVSTMLRARHSEAANEYLTQFIQDLNGASSMHGATNPLFGFFGKFKKTAVAASMSVVAQQPTAILRALAVMDAKYFVAMPKMQKLATKWDELQKYAPIAIIKDIGGFDAGGGRQEVEWLNSETKRGVDKAMSKLDDLTMLGAALGDQIGWTTIWEAVKRETKATTNLKEGSEEFLKKAGERFTEVIVLTQVYDSTLSRSGFMRSKHESVKMMTSFMGEPTVSFNMLMNAVVQAKDKKITKRNAARIIGSVYASVVAASIAASMIYALRDDDEDESYLEKFAESLSGKLKDEINPINMLPIMRDLMSIMDGWDVERTDISVFKDLKDAFDGLSSENKSAWRKTEDFAGALASLFGVPVKNMLRTGREIYNLFDGIFDDITPSGVGEAFVRGITGEKKDKRKALYDAIVNGDEARLKIYREGYKNDKSYETAIRKALRENDPRIKEAAQAIIDEDFSEYTRLANQIIGEGNFSEANIVAAIKSEVNEMTKDDEDAEEETEDKEVSIYEMNYFYSAVVDGDTVMAHAIREDIIRTKVANGDEREDAEKSFNSSFQTRCRKEYEAGNLSASEAISMLVNYGGKTEKEARSRVQAWDSN